MAFQLHDSRVRIEDFVPERIPKFKGVRYKGGLLGGQDVKFSSNLTCIIGGRGTGKSTLMETICAASGNESAKDLVDSEVWPDEITLLYEDDTGRLVEFVRSKNADAFNNTDGYEGLINVPLEYYGQGDASRTLSKGDDDPKSLLEFLDGFVSVEELKAEDSNVCDQLRKNRSEVEKLRIEIATMPEVERKIRDLKEKKKRLEKDKVSELVTYQTALVREKTLREDLKNELTDLVNNYRNVLSDKTILDRISSFPDEEIVVGKKQFVEVKRIIDEFSSVVTIKSDELNRHLTEKIEQLKDQLKAWSGKEKEIQKKIDEKKEELEIAGIPFDIGKINQMANELDYYEKKLRRLKSDRGELANLIAERKALMRSRKDIRRRIYNDRNAFAILVNENLKNTVDGLFVSVKYQEGCYSPEFEQGIKQLMDWRTSQVNKASALARTISPIVFAEEVRRKNKRIFTDIKDQQGSGLLRSDEVEKIIEKGNEDNNYEDFESIAFEDRPSILVTKLIKKDGASQRVSRSITKLSLGQQQSILLAILIQSKSSLPLLIDQPEDNLDSEFIYKTIVANLRKIKEKRQVIIVTHNPNIAVLGDAELIIPLKSTNEKSVILNRGSIDRESIRKECCSILEGGERAFLSRQKIYSLDRS